MDEYIIHMGTLALVPVGEFCTEVYEQNGIISINESCTKIIENSCLFYGSTLDGRRKGTESMIGVKYKAPIIIEESNELIFFPTSSTKANKSAWILLSAVKNYYVDNNILILELYNRQKIYLNYSYGVIDNQILRSTRLESTLRGRKNAKKRFNQGLDMV